MYAHVNSLLFYHWTMRIKLLSKSDHIFGCQIITTAFCNGEPAGGSVIEYLTRDQKVLVLSLISHQRHCIVSLSSVLSTGREVLKLF